MRILKKIDELEKQGMFIDSLNTLEEEIRSDSKDTELWSRVIFLLWYLLLEGDFDKLIRSRDDLEEKLKDYFDASKNFHYKNPDFSFYLGYIMQLSEWYFERPDISDVISESHQLITYASESNPENLLFKWGYLLVVKHSEQARLVALEIIERVKKGDYEQLSNRGILEEYFNAALVGSLKYS